MKIMIDHEVRSRRFPLVNGEEQDHHTTRLDQYKFERHTARFQNVGYWDVWDAGGDANTGPNGDYRIVGGNGVTLEGHGDGIRVLVNSKIYPRSLIIKYLNGLVTFLEQGIDCEQEIPF